jgi:hypothetical protein
MLSVVSARLDARVEWSKFDSRNSGHVILLIAGLCHEYGALTQVEVRSLCKSLGLSEIRFDNLVYCAILLGWLQRIRKGNHVFYASSAPQEALSYNFKDAAQYRDKLRWRSDVRAFWKTKDPSRLRAIATATSGTTR